MTSKIKLINPLKHKELLFNIQEEHKGKVEGIFDLYNQLYSLGKCESYNLDRIYYIAYTLAANKIKFVIET